MMLCQSDANYLQGILFCFLNQFVLFFPEQCDVPVCNYYFMARSLLTCGSQVYQNRSTLHCLNSLPQMGAMVLIKFVHRQIQLIA